LTLPTTLNRKAESEFSLLQLLKLEVLADPHALYRKLRNYEPVHWDHFLQSWVVTSYAEAVIVLTKFNAARTPSPERMEEMDLGVLSPYAAMMQEQILFMDAPDHTRIRSICAVAFIPARINLLRESIQTIADRLINKVITHGKMDILADFAAQFPAIVLTALLGLPEADSPQLRVWATNLGELAGNFEQDAERMEQLAQSLAELRSYIAQQVQEQQIVPRDGVISALLAAKVDGEALSLDEIIANAILFIGAGLEETANLIANGMLSLLQRPAQQARLTEHPELIASAVEELLRFESTTQYTGRVATEDTILGGQQIREGDAVTVVIAAANRDPQRFSDPDELDLTRPDNRHLAFSWASHYCLGAPLARIAAAIAFSTLLRRLPELTLVTTTPQWRTMAAMRSIRSLHVSFSPEIPDVGALS